MDRVTADPSQMRDLAEDFAQAAAGVNTELAELRDAVTDLVLAWSGEAEEAFEVSYLSYTNRAAMHAERLSAIAGMMRQVAEEYGRIDRESARALGGQ